MQRSIDAGNVDNDLLFDCATENEWLMSAKKERQRRKADGEDLAHMDELANAAPIMYQGAVVTYDTALAEVIDATTPDAELDKPCSARTTEIPQSI